MGSINDEKAAIVYYTVCQENEEKGKGSVSLKNFLDRYEKLFSMTSKNPYRNMDLKKNDILKLRKEQYVKIHNELCNSSLEEVLAYRNKFMKITDRIIPEDLLVDAKAKGLYVDLKKNTDTFLSGYNISYKQTSVTTKPYQLTESDVRKIIEEFPASQKAIVNQETNLINILHDDTAQRLRKKSELDNFKMIYTTHNFQVNINRYLMKECTDQSLALSAISLCSRAGIVNLQNNKPIMLRFCKADSKAKKELHRVKKEKKKKQKSHQHKANS